MGSDYDAIASGASVLRYITEVIHGRPHLNQDHPFSRRILALIDSLKEPEAKAEICYLIEGLNIMLEGKRLKSVNITSVQELVSKHLRDAGIPEALPETGTLVPEDFPPGFFQSPDVPWT
jgi:hypothetical protein